MTSRGFASSVRGTVTCAAGTHTATGTLSSSGEPRLVALNGYELDTALEDQGGEVSLDELRDRLYGSRENRRGSVY